MSNTDRLREAADAIDPCHGTGIVPCWSPGGPCPDGQSSCECCGPCRQVEQHAVAALLRAMADDLEIGLYIVGAESPAAALALADVILGVTDE